ncbi:MAG: UbiA family prenyltransferase [Planctomycetota bacterium]|nr:UbiA family prenyltransferase [Planctomycetota bacterium]
MSHWVRFFRLRLAWTALSNVIAGVALAGWAVDFQLWAMLLIWTLALYMLGMGLNDYSDRKRDQANSPERPIPAGKISTKVARRVLSLLFMVVVSVVIWMPSEARIFASAAIACVLLYDLFFKEIPLVGPLAMGGVRASIVLVGAAFAGAAADSATLIHAVEIGLFTAAVTHFSQEEERGRSRSLQLRFLLVCLVVVFSYSLLTAPALANISVTVVILAWLVAVGLPSRRRPASTCTFGLLTALPLVDLRAVVTYPQLLVPALIVLSWILLRPWTLLGNPEPSSRRSQ